MTTRVYTTQYLDLLPSDSTAYPLLVSCAGVSLLIHTT